MQTFLPYPDFRRTARLLDSKRLGKQRVEAKQILKALTVADYGWQYHPAVKMWDGYLDALKLYTNTVITEWERRGFHNTMLLYDLPDVIEMPFWLGDDRLHTTHKQNLIRKDPIRYGRLWSDLEPRQGYFWPYRRVKGEWVRKL